MTLTSETPSVSSNLCYLLDLEEPSQAPTAETPVPGTRNSQFRE